MGTDIAAKICATGLMCSEVLTAKTPAFECRKAVNTECDTDAANNALCGTNLTCEAADSLAASTCKIVHGGACDVATRSAEDNCATGLVCQVKEGETSPAAVCHREAGETCNDGTAGADDTCELGSKCVIEGILKKCKI